MGFNSVYRSLQDIFPQVDARLLRAVAIEHPKDADLAAGIVLTEVIPFLSTRLPPATPSQDNDPRAPNPPINVEVGSDVDMGSFSAPHSKATDCSAPDLNVTLNHFTEEISDNIVQEANENLDEGQVHVDVDSGSLISSGICQEMEPEQNYCSKEAASSDNNDIRGAKHLNLNQNYCSEEVASSDNNDIRSAKHLNLNQNYCSEEAASSDNNYIRSAKHLNLNEEWVDFLSPSADDYDATISDKSQMLKKCETALIEVESSEAQGHTPNVKDSLQSEFDSGPSFAVGENVVSDSTFFKQDFCESEISDVEDEIGEDNAVSQSNQVCRIDLLEEIINESKANKGTLFSSMESLINLMKEVELQETAAEQAKMEATRGGSDILVRVEEYKTMLAHAKEANDMHAGEVNGEKAILATEVKELQSRLLSLSDERDKSLAILDEMRQILESRLAAAEELRKAAEHERLEKEECARKALAKQEAMMEKVVHESLRLQQEAEENSKLREFLMDRGHHVDMLQGEISVICQDIRLLKEKFDANLPLSKSFTYNQTSCILASSGSSHKTLASDVGSVHSGSSEILKTSPAASIASGASKIRHEEKRSKAEHDDLDDGWDIFEKDAELLHCEFVNLCSAQREEKTR